MKYLRQYHGMPTNSLASEWAHIKADTPQDAALKGLTIDKIGKADMVYAYVAIDKPENRHKTGMPIAVHRFDLKIDRPQ